MPDLVPPGASAGKMECTSEVRSSPGNISVSRGGFDCLRGRAEVKTGSLHRGVFACPSR